MDLKNKIRLVGADLDGTLLNDRKELCIGAAETIAEAKQNGIHIVPITGRPYQGIPQCILNLKEIDYIICSNGAQIISYKTGECIFSSPISNSKSREVIKILTELDCIFEPFADGCGYSQPHIFESYMQQFKGTPIEDYITSSRKIVDDSGALFRDGTREADEFFVNCKEAEVRAALIERLDKIGGVQYCNLGDRFMEITKQGTDKGAALETICHYLGIGISETIAFGDGENDLLFLEKAGVAVAMENAFPSVKEKADIIAKSNNDNGVCEIIKQLY